MNNLCGKQRQPVLAALVVMALLGAMASTAQAALRALEEAYELNASLVERWPSSDVGSLVLRPCPNCEPVMLRVDANTLYRLGMRGAVITRAELVERQALLRDRRNTFVYVFYEPGSRIATRVVLDVTAERSAP